ncbi:FtsX-like permease family protein [Paenibacillus sp. MMS20-IR301]|uniref:ABC transporter permease n=1 Tax=Paenibacillus sp. MMS20-IR301 TaxID=2895946 RepID=UPI0028F0E30B|nr:FtsX-like permease family protein [Paenibacillus sp. MMS20-IR301]WNS45384.1 FtsX-like permease family protein [Paenibacillus sp. MMS20-IR301]
MKGEFIVFLKILKKDLRRKKVMNTVLLVLITLASTLVASSSSLMYSTSKALDSFITGSKVADLNITVENKPGYTADIQNWVKDEPKVAAVYTSKQIPLTLNQIGLPEGRTGFSGNTSIVLSGIPDQVNLIFGEDDKRYTLHQGEIGLPASLMLSSGVQQGEKITLQLGEFRQTFTVSGYFKDAYMGADLLGLKRMMITAEDFTGIEKQLPDDTLLSLWSFTAAPGVAPAELSNVFAGADLPVKFEVDKSLVSMAYMTDRIISAMMFAISLFLIFIALLTLRFTIVSTLQDEYKEIGIMKATGFRSIAIKRLYLTKYMGLSLFGGAAGLGISLPLTGLMSRRTSQYMIMPGGSTSIIISALSTVAMIGFILLFCLLCMRKINKASAIDAIRYGQTGERFKASRRIHLHTSRFLPAPLFLALSDVLNRLKSYTSLILTLILSTAIMLIPVNLTNTIVTPKFLEYFGTIEADLYSQTVLGDFSTSELEHRKAEITQKLREKGFDVTLSANYTLRTKYISDNGQENRRVNGQKNDLNTSVSILEGTAPVLKNEIAITTIMAEKYGKQIGDSIDFEIDSELSTYLITGLFQSISNEGYAVWIARDYDPQLVNAYVFSGNINAPEDQKAGIAKEIQAQLGDLNLKTSFEMLGEITGGFMGQLRSINALLTAVICIITFFINSLFVRLLITKEVHGIAVMKSIGFTNSAIRQWQILRILIIMAASTILGVVAANTLGGRLLGMVFRIFGLTKLDLNIVPLQVYVLYPLLILAVVMLAVFTSCGQIKRVQVWNMNKE